MSTLDYILSIISLGATVATGVTTGTAADAAKLSSALIEIVQKAMLAHEQVTGQPIDVSLLKPFVPLE